MRYIGIDPGKQGAMALLSPGGRVIDLQPTPLVHTGGGPKGPRGGKAPKRRSDYDLREIHALLQRWQFEDPHLFAVVELLLPMPSAIFRGGGGRQGNSAQADYARGVAQGWRWMFTALGIAHVSTFPKTWQKVMHQGVEDIPDTKARSLEVCARRFPDVELQRTARSTVRDDGMAEAVLLAEYGRRLCEAQDRRSPAPVMEIALDEAACVGAIGRVE